MNTYNKIRIHKANKFILRIIVILCIANSISLWAQSTSKDTVYKRTLESESLTDAQFQQFKNIVRKAEIYRGNEQGNFYYDMQVIDKSGDEVKSDTRLKVNINQQVTNDERSTLIHILSGSSKGNKILQKDINMWFYKPGTATTLRISPAQRLIGGASYSDVSSTNYTINYDPVSVTEETLGKTPAYKLELQKIKQGVTYDKIYFYVSKDQYRPIKSEFYTISGRLIKTMYFRNFKNIKLGNTSSLITTEWVIVDQLKDTNVTFINIVGMGKETLPESSYTPEGLLR